MNTQTAQSDLIHLDSIRTVTLDHTLINSVTELSIDSLLLSVSFLVKSYRRFVARTRARICRRDDTYGRSTFRTEIAEKQQSPGSTTWLILDQCRFDQLFKCTNRSLRVHFHGFQLCLSLFYFSPGEGERGPTHCSPKLKIDGHRIYLFSTLMKKAFCVPCLPAVLSELLIHHAFSLLDSTHFSFATVSFRFWSQACCTFVWCWYDNQITRGIGSSAENGGLFVRTVFLVFFVLFFFAE